MRLVAISLVLLNVFYFLYEVGVPETVMESVSLAREEFSLTLLAEAQSDGTSNQRDNNFIKTLDFSESIEEAYCNSIGEVKSIPDGHLVIDALAQAGIRSKLEIVNRLTGKVGFQVSIPSVPSLEQAFIILKDLKSENIEGRIISERKKALGISLGVFPTLEAAKEFRSTHEKEGAMIAETPLVERTFVILTEDAEAADISSILDSLKTNINVTSEQEACDRY